MTGFKRLERVRKMIGVKRFEGVARWERGKGFKRLDGVRKVAGVKKFEGVTRVVEVTRAERLKGSVSVFWTGKGVKRLNFENKEDEGIQASDG